MAVRADGLIAIGLAIGILGLLPACAGSSATSAARCVVAMRCEAEDAVLTGTRPETDGPGRWPGYSGSDFVVGYEHAGTSIAWTVDGAAGGGSHVIDLRFSNNRGQDGKTQARSLTLVVNDRSRQVVFPPTQSWSAWSDLRVADVALVPGANTMRLECTPMDTGRVNIDFMTIY